MQNVNEELTVVFAETRATGLSHFQVPTRQAECWKERSTLARHLSTMVRQIQAINTTVSPEGVLAIDAGSMFEAELILAHPILVRASGWTVEPLAVGVPARDRIFIADPKRPQAIEHLKEKVAQAYHDRPHAISDQLFLVSSCQIKVLKDGQPAGEQGQSCMN